MTIYPILMDVAFAGSIITNFIVLWNWAKARDHAEAMRHRSGGWRKAAEDWRRLYLELRETCHRRDPKTGRLMKKGY